MHHTRSMFVALVTASACTGPAGEMGEMGPPGEMGEMGEPGAPGAPGASGSVDYSLVIANNPTTPQVANFHISGRGIAETGLRVGAELAGTAMSAVVRTNAGMLGTAVGSELALASIGFRSGNNSAFGIRARRVANGSDWTTTAIGFGMDVDNTVRAAGGSGVWLHANGGVGIGHAAPRAALDVAGGIRTSLSGSTVQTLQSECPSCTPNRVVHNLNIQGPQLIMLINGDYPANNVTVAGIKTYDASSFTFQTSGGTPGALARWNWVIFQL